MMLAMMIMRKPMMIIMLKMMIMMMRMMMVMTIMELLDDDENKTSEMVLWMGLGFNGIENGYLGPL